MIFTIDADDATEVEPFFKALKLQRKGEPVKLTLRDALAEYGYVTEISGRIDKVTDYGLTIDYTITDTGRMFTDRGMDAETNYIKVEKIITASIHLLDIVRVDAD